MVICEEVKVGEHDQAQRKGQPSVASLKLIRCPGVEGLQKKKQAIYARVFILAIGNLYVGRVKYSLLFPQRSSSSIVTSTSDHSTSSPMFARCSSDMWV